MACQRKGNSDSIEFPPDPPPVPPPTIPTVGPPPPGPPPVGPVPPTQLILSSGSTLNAGECNPVIVTSTDSNNVTASVLSKTPIRIDRTGEGDTYEDNQCIQSTNLISLLTGENTKTFYFLSNEPGESTIAVDATPLLAGTDSVTVIILPQTDVSISNAPQYDFGPLFTGVMSQKTFTVTNSGPSSVTGLAQGTPALSAPFSFLGGSYPGTGGTCGNTLSGGGGTCTLVVSFAPTAEGVFSQTLFLSFSDGVSTLTTSRPLMGTGVSHGSLDIKLTTPMDSGEDRALAVAVQPDGKIILAGFSNRNATGFDFAVARYLTTGALDPSFGQQGKVYIPFLTGTNDDRAVTMALQPDGYIVLGGYTWVTNNYDFALVRLDPTGNPDTSFGTSGKVTTRITIRNDFLRKIALLSDGKIVGVGDSQKTGSKTQVTVVRYLSNGTLDTSFGSGGIMNSEPGTSSSYGYSLALQTDNKIVVSGFATNLNRDFLVMRFLTTGSLDPAFGTGGVVLSDFNVSADQAYAVALQPDGKIIVGGTSIKSGQNHSLLMRYHANGTLDTTFDVDGKVSILVSPTYDEIQDIQIQPADGKIVTAGFGFNGPDYDFAVTRTLSNGGPDTGFGSNGKVLVPFGTGLDQAFALALEGNGNIVAAGHSHDGTFNDFAMCRIFP